MCGRFALTADPQTIQQAFDLDTVPANLQPRYNIAPSQPIGVIPNNNPKALEFFRWGLVPSWSKDLSIGNKMINARAETAHEKPSFRDAFKKRRCIIPASGFYEWAQSDKTPMYVHLKDDEVFGFAGLWESWKSPEGEKVLTCTILTTEPNELLSNFHHRMAVILRREDYAAWLSPDPMTVDELMPLLQPYPSDEMAAYEVSKLVNSPSNDHPDCVVPMIAPNQPGLFN
jgi:putative SOS response-associated peptidase YedK